MLIAMRLRLIIRKRVTPAGEHVVVLPVSTDDPTTRAIIETSFQLEIINVRRVDDVGRYLDLCKVKYI